MRLLSITIDPVRDTPDMLAEAAALFEASDKWVWLTGAPADIDSLLGSFDAQVTDIELHDPIFLVCDPESGSFYRSLAMPTADELVALLETFRT